MVVGGWWLVDVGCRMSDECDVGCVMCVGKS